MKKFSSHRLILTTAVTLLFAVGLFAQTPIPGYDNGAGGDNYDNAGVTYVTVGKTVPLYAAPDPYYHPAYNPVNGTGLNAANFTWDWTSADAPANFTFGSASDNYVEVTGVNPGSYTVNVVETAPAAWGGCDDGTGQNITINVVAAPSLQFDETALTSSTYEECEGGTLPAAIEAVIGGGYQAFKLAWTLEIKTLKTDGSDSLWYDDEAGTNPATSAKFATGGEYTETSPETVASSGNHDITTVGSFDVIDNLTTRYTYVLGSINDQASRWGDFLDLVLTPGVNATSPDDFQYYAAGGTFQTLQITVHPTPTTGPIFHIDAGWAN